MGNHQPSPNEGKINVLIVDDHPIMREGVRRVLEMEPDIAVIAEAGNGEDGLEIAHRLQPHVVLLDINLPVMNGLEVTKRLKSDRSSTAVVLLTAYDDAEQIVHAIKAGASAYCPKDIPIEQLLNVIRQAARGNYVIDQKVYNERGLKEWLENRVRDMSGPHVINDAEPFGLLSSREMEILRCVTRGLSNKQIGQELGISQQTVKNHMTSILDKLKVGGRTQAAVYALQRGWVRAKDYRTPTQED